MFNTAVTRAKQWLVVVGEPFTLCTVGENRLCWMEFIRCCQQLGSFDYTNADQFVEESLDHKIIVRQVLENVYKSFFGPNRGHTLTQGTPTPTQPTGTVYAAAKPQQKLELLKSMVKQSAQNIDNDTVNKITGTSVWCVCVWGGGVWVGGWVVCIGVCMCVGGWGVCVWVGGWCVLYALV